MKDDHAPIRVREAGVEFLEVGMTGKTAAGRGAGVEVAGAFVIGDEVNAGSDPHRGGQVSLERDERAVGAAALAIDPESPGRSASITFPACRVGGIPADHDPGAAGLMRNGPGRPDPQRLGRSAIERNGVKVHHPAEGLLPVGRDNHMLAVPAPTDHLGNCSHEGEPARHPAFGIHHPGFRMALVPAREGDLGPVG